jgi:hypothetical protein
MCGDVCLFTDFTTIRVTAACVHPRPLRRMLPSTRSSEGVRFLPRVVLWHKNTITSSVMCVFACGCACLRACASVVDAGVGQPLACSCVSSDSIESRSDWSSSPTPSSARSSLSSSCARASTLVYACTRKPQHGFNPLCCVTVLGYLVIHVGS